jgi:hypothetical protein
MGKADLEPLLGDLLRTVASSQTLLIMRAGTVQVDAKAFLFTRHAKAKRLFCWGNLNVLM